MVTTELTGQIRELIDTGAGPITLSEITARRRAAPVPEFRPAPARTRVRLGWAAAVAAAAVVVGSTGAITAAQLAAGRAAAPSAGRPAGPAGTLLTAAQVRQVAAASRAALSHSARAYITYLGPYHAFQYEDVAFSGENYSFVGSLVNSSANGRPGQVAWFAERVVNGQAYDRVLDSGGWRWFHYAPTVVGHPARVLDPRTVLSVLAPSERFRFAGHAVVGRVPLERLAASDLANVPALDSLMGVRAGESVNALDVLVDSHGVVHQMDISLGVTLTAAASGPGKPAGGGRLAGHGPTPVTQTGSTNMTVTFADIGQPQVINVPWHAINSRTRWGADAHAQPPSLLPSAGVAPS
jgi:hypothetical protein